MICTVLYGCMNILIEFVMGIVKMMILGSGFAAAAAGSAASIPATVVNVVFLILVFAGTIYGVFHGEDLGEIARILKTVNLLWLIPGFICVIVFIWGESIIIYYMMRTLKIRLKKWTCFLFSSVGFFFSCITPSASGGQPAQIYYMKKEKIPIPVSTLVLMIVTITYKLVLVVVGLWLVLFGQGFIHKYLWSIRHIFIWGQL